MLPADRVHLRTPHRFSLSNSATVWKMLHCWQYRRLSPGVPTFTRGTNPRQRLLLWGRTCAQSAHFSDCLDPGRMKCKADLFGCSMWAAHPVAPVVRLFTCQVPLAAWHLQ